jgi:hypothetical protein
MYNKWRSKRVFLRVFEGENIKIAAKYCAIIKTRILYPLMTERKLNNLIMVVLSLGENIQLEPVNQL